MCRGLRGEGVAGLVRLASCCTAAEVVLVAADSVRATMGNVSARTNDQAQMVTEPTEAINVPPRRRIEAV